jgi:hypothetical protein
MAVPKMLGKTINLTIHAAAGDTARVADLETCNAIGAAMITPKSENAERAHAK